MSFAARASKMVIRPLISMGYSSAGFGLRSLSTISEGKSLITQEMGTQTTKPGGRSKSSPEVSLVLYGSQEAAPADSAPLTNNMAGAILEIINQEEAQKLGITICPKITRLDDPRQGSKDPRDNLNIDNGIRNFENVFKAYLSHYIAVASCLLKDRPSKPFGIGGDHGMGAANLRATAFSYGIRDICDGTIECDDKLRGEVIGLKKEFNANPCEETIYRLGKRVDKALEADFELMKQWTKSLKKIAVLWFDAHGDINTPVNLSVLESDLVYVVRDSEGRLAQFSCNSTSGNFHGMPVATAMGFGPQSFLEVGSVHAKIFPDNITFVGCRDLDFQELISIKKLQELFGLKFYGPEDLRKKGLNALYRELIESAKDLRWVIEHDVDGANAARYPGTGTPVGPGSKRNPLPGASHYITRQAVRFLATLSQVVSIGLSEGAAPGFDGKDSVYDVVSKEAAEETFHSTWQIMCSFLGLNSDQKRLIFPGYTKYKESESHKSYKNYSIETEKELQEKGLFIPLHPYEKPLGMPKINSEKKPSKALMLISEGHERA